MLFEHLCIVKEDLKCNRIQIQRTLSSLQNDLLEMSDKMCQSCKSGKISDSSQEEDHCRQTESGDLAQKYVPLKKTTLLFS